MIVSIWQGSLYIFEPNENEAVIQLLDASVGAFVGADFIVPGNKHCVVRNSRFY